MIEAVLIWASTANARCMPKVMRDGAFLTEHDCKYIGIRFCLGCTWPIHLQTSRFSLYATRSFDYVNLRSSHPNLPKGLVCLNDLRPSVTLGVT